MKHSTLSNAADLHYAKIRTFTGDPSLIGADFVDQILVATDSNKIYRATASGLIELVAKRPQGEGAGAIFTGQGYPAPDIPRSVGALYFDFQNLMQYICALEYSEKGWIATQNNFNISSNINRVTYDYANSDITLALYYSENLPNPPFNFSDLVSAEIGLDQNIGQTIGKLIHSRGLGYYALAVSQPTEGLAIYDLYLYTGSNYDILTLGSSGEGLTVNNQPIIGKFFSFLAYPANKFECSLTIQI